LCDFFWNKLDYDGILKKCGLNSKEIDLVKVLIFGRLISPGSERHTINWFFNQSSLLETLSTDLSKTGMDAFYNIGDILYAQKDKIERLLRENTKQLFPYSDTVILYDLTNTYFEGRQLNSKLCKRGKSKEKRTDCPLVTLALVVDQHGFPVICKIYKGNQSEPLTLKEILNKLYEPSNNIFDIIEKPSIAMDRGIATKDNVSYLKENNYSYFIIERREVSKLYKEEFSDIKETGIAYETKPNRQYILKGSIWIIAAEY
jgi:transposase